jgi:hypothetical protein
VGASGWWVRLGGGGGGVGDYIYNYYLINYSSIAAACTPRYYLLYSIWDMGALQVHSPWTNAMGHGWSMGSLSLFLGRARFVSGGGVPNKNTLQVLCTICVVAHGYIPGCTEHAECSSALSSLDSLARNALVLALEKHLHSPSSYSASFFVRV